MIHIQNWKIYASHYNDDTSELGLEFKKAQQDSKMYGEKMGVPITEELVVKSKRPSVDDQFPYIFHGTDVEDYKQAQFIQQNNGPEGRHNYLPQQQCASRRILLVRYELIGSRSLL